MRETLWLETWGRVEVYLNPYPDRMEVTIFGTFPENEYRVTHAPGDTEEVDWSGYLLGARTYRIDRTVSREDSDSVNTVQMVADIISSEFASGEVGGFYVEPLNNPFFSCTEAELCEHWLFATTIIAKLEKDLREQRRIEAQTWTLGEERYGWEM